MSVQFENKCSLVLLFSNDLNHILLKQNKGKLDGLFFNNGDKIQEVDNIEKIKSELSLELKPEDLRIVISLQNIDRIWKIDCYMTIVDISKIVLPNDLFKIWDVKNDKDPLLHPNLSWLIPLSIDASVYGTAVNQVLMK